MDKYLCRWTGSDHTEYTVIYVALYFLAGLDSHQTIDCCACEQKLPWYWTEEAAPWISQELGLTVLHIAGVVLGIALCWCWQCLLTVHWNLLPNTVTPLDVTTVAWYSRQTQDVLHPAGCPPEALQTLEGQWTAKVFTHWPCTGRYNHLFTADKCLQT